MIKIECKIKAIDSISATSPVATVTNTAAKDGSKCICGTADSG